VTQAQAGATTEGTMARARWCWCHLPVTVAPAGAPARATDHDYHDNLKIPGCGALPSCTIRDRDSGSEYPSRTMI
jgi:hypothetical protein